MEEKQIQLKRKREKTKSTRSLAWICRWTL